MQILILGAEGFLGKNLTIFFKKKNNFDIISLSRKQLNVNNSNALKETLKSYNPNYVFNCASFVGGIEFGNKFPVELLEKNILRDINLYKSVLKNSKKSIIINPISNCIYPKKYKTYTEKNIWNGEMDDSVKFYGHARKTLITISEAYRKKYNIFSYNPIFSNMYGPYDHFEEFRSHALGALIMKAVNFKLFGGKINVWGDGSAKREWLYVNDACKAFYKIMSKKPKETLFNVGSNYSISIKNLIFIITDILDIDKKNILFDKSKPTGVKDKKVDNTKGNQLLDWCPSSLNLRKNIKYTIDWYYKMKVNSIK